MFRLDRRFLDLAKYYVDIKYIDLFVMPIRHMYLPLYKPKNNSNFLEVY